MIHFSHKTSAMLPIPVKKSLLSSSINVLLAFAIVYISTECTLCRAAATAMFCIACLKTELFVSQNSERRRKERRRNVGDRKNKKRVQCVLLPIRRVFNEYQIGTSLQISNNTYHYNINWNLYKIILIYS